MEEKIISTRDLLMVYPVMFISYVVAVLVLMIGSPYWAYMLIKNKK